MNLSLRSAGLGLIAILFAVSLSTMAASLWSKTYVQERIEAETAEDLRVRDLILPLVAALKDMELDTVQVQQYLSDVSATRTDESFKDAEKNAKEFTEHSESAKALAEAMGETEMVTALAGMQAEFPEFYRLGREMAKVYLEEGTEAGNRLMPQFDKMADHIGEEIERIGKRRDSLVIEAGEKSRLLVEELNASMQRAAWVAIGAALVTLAFLAVAALGLQRLFIAPIDEMTGLLERLAQGDSNVETRLAGWRNEIGRMARTAKIFAENASERRRLEQAAANERQREIERQKAQEQQIARFRGVIGEVIGSVNAETERMGDTAQILDRVASHAESTAGSARAGAEDSSRNIGAVSASSDQLAASVSIIAEKITVASAAANKAATTARATDHNISSLAAASEKVGAIAGLIAEIAQETNLLALNATIEAARAGEAGRGFGVVAAEVKTLAGRTAKATEEVAAQISAIQSATQRAVEDIRAIAGAVEDIDHLTGEVARSVMEQNGATADIASAMTRASQSSQAASDGVAQVASAIGETHAQSSQVTQAAGKLSSSTKRLAEAVESFLGEVTQDVRDRRAATRRTATQGAIVSKSGGREDVRLLDISETGARLAARSLHAQGEQIEIEFEDRTRAMARVVWSNGGMLGVEFMRPLSDIDAKAA